MTSTEWLSCLSRLYSGDECRPLPKGWPTLSRKTLRHLRHLGRKTSRVRRTEAELWADYAEVLPVVLGSLLDLTVKVRAVEAETPTDLRMADFLRRQR
ncbi:hypothetical protein [Streptomyces sp. AcE210]|uniref:hypothetical protein n=1 Tax=Streptomyces sp. AcE210 TaxID=2292703 RepID=UPI0014049474|nr:hypothetical protein [Streptomyces sp. AcE210]